MSAWARTIRSSRFVTAACNSAKASSVAPTYRFFPTRRTCRRHKLRRSARAKQAAYGKAANQLAAHQKRGRWSAVSLFLSLAGEGRVMSCCRLETERLLLRPPEPRDVPAIVTWIGDWDVAKNLSRCPHPYIEQHAQEFLARAAEGRAKGTDFNFAITRRGDAQYMGQIGLHLKDGRFELGYWLGKPFWGSGYASEAARRV